jgi:hypothetical protein
MTRSVHDNIVLGYSVDCEGSTILLLTEFRDQGEPFERTDVRFEGVIGYLFRDNLGGILFGVVEDTIDNIVSEYAAEFEWGARYGWPWISACKDIDPREFVASQEAKVFCIQSSIGFDGFVIGKSMTVEAVE